MTTTTKPSVAIPATITKVLTDPQTTREQKIKRLVEMGLDALALDRASSEGMTGPSSNVNAIHEALRRLGAESAIDSIKEPAYPINPGPHAASGDQATN